MGTPYKICDPQWFWRGPEPAYADFDNNGTKDETNAATGTFWTCPVYIGQQNPVLIRKQKLWTKYSSGSRFTTHIDHIGYKDIILTFSGPVMHRSWLYYLTDAVTTADDPPKYTHVYVNTATHVNPPKSFELLHKEPNDTSAETVLTLYTGCTVVSYVESGNLSDNTITGTWTVKARNTITGTALTTPGYPAYPSLNFMNFSNAVLTWTKGGVATAGSLKGYTFEFITDRDLTKEGGSYYPVATKSPNNVMIRLKIKWCPFETDSYDETQDDQLAANNRDVSLKISRSATDYFEIAYVDCFAELDGDPTYENGEKVESIMFEKNPHEATPSTVTLTEVNALDDDQYET